MCLRPVVLCAPGLVLLAALHPNPRQPAQAADPGAALAAIERPRILGEIDPPEVLAVGHAEIRPSAGARVMLLSADSRVCGVLIDGQPR